MLGFFSNDHKFYKEADIPIEESEITFDVYQRYLENYTKYIKKKFKSQTALANNVLIQTNKIQSNKNLNIEFIKKFLFIGWNTECLIRLNDEQSSIEIIRVNNQWKPIQAYYSIYSISEARLYALGRSGGSHSSCLSNISSFFVQMKNLDPWSFSFTGFKGNSKIISNFAFINFPKDIIPAHPLSDISQPVESIACCIRAEHRKRIDEHKKGKRDRFKYLYDPGYTSFFHFLYRLRIKSNYKNAEIFLAEAPNEKIEAFSKNLSFICEQTNTVLETIILRKIGRNALIDLMDEFSSTNDLVDVITKRKNMFKH